MGDRSRCEFECKQALLAGREVVIDRYFSEDMSCCSICTCMRLAHIHSQRMISNYVYLQHTYTFHSNTKSSVCSFAQHPLCFVSDATLMSGSGPLGWALHTKGRTEEVCL